MKITHWVAAAIGLMSFAAASAPAARADDYPTKPVTIVVPFGPGSATDIVARVLAPQLTKSLGQNFLVVNRPGAFGIIAMQELVRQPADGYTLMVGNVSTNAITPVIYKDKMKFDYVKSIRAIAQLVEIPALFLASATHFQAKTMADFVAYAKAHPSSVRYTSTGIGSFVQYDSELLAQRAGITLVHVPLKGGGGEMANSLAIGDTQVGFVNAASAEGLVKAGKLTPLAAIGDKRLDGYPNVPTMTEVGFPGVGTQLWNGIFIHADTPKPIVDKLYKAVAAAMVSDESAKAFKATGTLVKLSPSPEAAEEWQLSEIKKWQQITTQVHIKLE